MQHIVTQCLLIMMSTANIIIISGDVSAASCNSVSPDYHSHSFHCLCPRLPLAGVGHIAFRRDVTFVRAYVRMSRS